MVVVAVAVVAVAVVVTVAGVVGVAAATAAAAAAMFILAAAGSRVGIDGISDAAAISFLQSVEPSLDMSRPVKVRE